MTDPQPEPITGPRSPSQELVAVQLLSKILREQERTNRMLAALLDSLPRVQVQEDGLPRSGFRPL